MLEALSVDFMVFRVKLMGVQILRLLDVSSFR